MKPRGILTSHGFIHAGSYLEIPEDADYVVNLTKEIPTKCSVRVPIRDFGVPDCSRGPGVPLPLVRAIMGVVAHLKQGKKVFVHCRGGIGRTGMFLSLMVKLDRCDTPYRTLGFLEYINFVRESYHPGAVETRDQENFIEYFPLVKIYRWAKMV